MGRRARFRILFGSLVLALTVSAVEVQPVLMPGAAATAGAVEPDDDGGNGPLVRPDSVSAQVTARASGKRVEDLSQGDAYTQVFAEPDGSWTSESASQPVRAVDGESGEWAPIDLTLIKVGGRLVPTNTLGDVSLSAGGDQVFANATPDDAADDGSAGSWRGVGRPSFPSQSSTVPPLRTRTRSRAVVTWS